MKYSEIERNAFNTQFQKLIDMQKEFDSQFEKMQHLFNLALDSTKYKEKISNLNEKNGQLHYENKRLKETLKSIKKATSLDEVFELINEVLPEEKHPANQIVYSKGYEMVKENDVVQVIDGYRDGDTGRIIWVDEENLVCKVIFDDNFEVYGYDVNSVEKIEEKYLKNNKVSD